MSKRRSRSLRPTIVVGIALRAIRFPVLRAKDEGNRKMTKKVISTIKHYKREKDGTLRFVGTEKREVEEHHWGHIKSLDWRDEADARRLARDQEDFERLVDNVCGE